MIPGAPSFRRVTVGGPVRRIGEQCRRRERRQLIVFSGGHRDGLTVSPAARRMTSRFRPVAISNSPATLAKRPILSGATVEVVSGGTLSGATVSNGVTWIVLVRRHRHEHHVPVRRHSKLFRAAPTGGIVSSGGTFEAVGSANVDGPTILSRRHAGSGFRIRQLQRYMSPAASSGSPVRRHDSVGATVSSGGREIVLSAARRATPRSSRAASRRSRPAAAPAGRRYRAAAR